MAKKKLPAELKDRERLSTKIVQELADDFCAVMRRGNLVGLVAYMPGNHPSIAYVDSGHDLACALEKKASFYANKGA